MTDYFGDIVIPDTLATTDELTAWLEADAPVNAAAILRGCTTLVIDATEGAFYDTDPATGIATNTLVAAAMKKAVLIQAAAWATLGIDPNTGGVQTLTKGLQTSKKIGSAMVTYSDGTGSQVAAAQQAAYTGLVPQAMKVLQQANLIGSNPWYYG